MISKERVDWLCKAIRECQIQTGGTIPPYENSGVYILSAVIAEAGHYVSNLKILYAPTEPRITLCFSKSIKSDFKMTRIFEDIANEYVWNEEN